MKNILITMAFLIGSLVASPMAFGDDDESFELKGKLFSASAIIPSGSSSALLAEVPEGKKLTVTQFCKNDFFGPELVGSELGRVPAELNSACTTYVPGVLFKGGQSISCVFLFGPAFQDLVCLINGVIQSADTD